MKTLHMKVLSLSSAIEGVPTLTPAVTAYILLCAHGLFQLQ